MSWSLNPTECAACCHAVQFQSLMRNRPELFQERLLDPKIPVSIRRVMSALVSLDDTQLSEEELGLGNRFREWYENNLRLGRNRKRRRLPHR